MSLHEEMKYTTEAVAAGVPFVAAQTLYYYHVEGLSPGGFLEALLACDLRQACLRADSINGPAIQAIFKWVYSKLPIGAWGSYQAVEAWCDRVL